MFSENWHVCFECIVWPGIILLLFGVDLLPRGCDFPGFLIPDHPGNKAGKRANPEGNKYLLAHHCFFFRGSVDLFMFLFLCCFRGSYFSRFPYLCELSDVPGYVIFCLLVSHFDRQYNDLA